jgi:pimeloyl-ACP methyl ester carboxylesterase
MATFVLIHGAGDAAWSWHLLAAELEARRHDVVAVDLPCDDDRAGLAEYADTVVAAIGERRDLVVVGHSFGAFTAPLVCARVPADRLVLLAPMIPAPGESFGDWWANTGYVPAEPGGDETATFFHDVPPALAAEAMRRERGQSATPLSTPWPLAAWPEVPTSVLICRDDRCFPAPFSRRVARQRLGITPDEIDGGHCVALSRPGALAEQLDAYATEGRAG